MYNNALKFWIIKKNTNETICIQFNCLLISIHHQLSKIQNNSEYYGIFMNAEKKKRISEQMSEHVYTNVLECLWE